PQTIDSLIGCFPSVFTDELGLFKDGSITIQTLLSTKPKFFKPRQVSYHLHDKVEQELNRLQQQGIITPVNFSSWAAPKVPVLKPDDSVRICGDYNAVLQADTYPLPRIEDLFSKLTGGTLFSKLDLAHAYQQIALDEESHKLTTINTHKGLFQYNRLPFGITSAPSIFQRILETLLANIPRVCVYLDDILVSGIDEYDHIQTLSQVLSKLENAGL
uniref:Reverse transcriptase domain-containing protein n=1 Tax=Amphimedon queenslandica TaxID=400682 RepID=A0A1X7SJ43_AMPQE